MSPNLLEWNELSYCNWVLSIFISSFILKLFTKDINNILLYIIKENYILRERYLVFINIYGRLDNSKGEIGKLLEQIRCGLIVI